MIQSHEFRNAVADLLIAAAAASAPLTALVGLDGFVDEILHVVDRRQDADHFDAVPTIAAYATRLAAAAAALPAAARISTRNFSSVDWRGPTDSATVF